MQTELHELFYESLAAFGVAHGVPVVTPNSDFDPTQASAYLEGFVLPVPPETYTIGLRARHLWILQVNVAVSDGTGDSLAYELVDALASAYPPLHPFQSLTRSFDVQTPPSPAVPISRPGWFVLPVSFRVQTLN